MALITRSWLSMENNQIVVQARIDNTKIDPEYVAPLPDPDETSPDPIDPLQACMVVDLLVNNQHPTISIRLDVGKINTVVPPTTNRTVNIPNPSQVALARMTGHIETFRA